MQDDTLPLNNSNATTTPLSTRLPFTKYDFGWVLLCIGMAIGAGTVLMPVQIGLKGIWVFITAFIIAYPATYIVQDIYLKTLSESETCDDYTDIISHYLGKNWGVFLGVIYFLMIIHGVFIYSLSVVFDSASYIKTFGLTEADLSQSIIYKVAIFAVLVAIASGGEKLLFKISGPMVVVKVGIILIFGFAMIPHWNLDNISAFPAASVFFRDVLLTIPFCFFSAVFIQVLNPMNIAYRKREPDRVLATRMAIRTHRISYITLIAIILFFSFSFTFSISHEEAVSAFEQNISALALAAQVIPGHIIHITSDRTTTRQPTSSDKRAPYIRRERTSRPTSSVPRICAQLPPSCQTGGASSASRNCSAGLYGAIKLANTAIRITMRTYASPTTAPLLRLK